MGFFSFGKKKKVEKLSSPPPASTTNRDKKPATLVNSASASSTLSNASSGSSSYSPPPNSQQPPVARRTNTSPAVPNRAHHRHSSALAPPPPLPALAGHGRLSGSSSTSNLRPGSHTSVNLSSSNTSLALPNAPYANGNALAKKGSSATLNSVRSVGGTPTKRGPHDPPARAVGLGSASGGSVNNTFNKQRAASYGYGVRNIWTTGTGPRSMDGHQYTGTHPAVFAGKHASTGSPGILANNGSSYIDAHNVQHALATDHEFKTYTRKYDMTIAKAHTLAREYHHLPPAKRDQAGYERIGHAFAAAAILSREHWNMRCAMEKERLEALLSRRRNGDALDADWEEPSSHRVAGMRACEGWQYASMLADAWGVNEETTMPLEEMPVLKPKHSTSDGYGHNTNSWYGDSNTNYMHPGYSPAAYASYVAQQQQHPPVSRGRYDSTASRASRAPSFSESVQMALDEGRERAISLSSTHTHSVLSHMPTGYASNQYPSTSHNPTPSHGHGSNHGHGSYVPSPLNRSAAGTAMTADEYGMKPHVEASREYSTSSVRGQTTRSRRNSEAVEKVEERQPIVLRRGVKHRNGSLGGRSVEGLATAVAH